MKSQFTEKIKGGKLLRIKVDYASSINKVEITGDFFAHPEEAINDIEQHLSTLDINFKKDTAIEDLRTLIEVKGYKLIGINAEAIINTLKRAIK